MNRNDLNRLLLLWVSDRLERGDRAALSSVGLDQDSLGWLKTLRTSDLSQLPSSSLTIRVDVNPQLPRKIEAVGRANQEWFLANGAGNSMMQFVFGISTQSIRLLRHSLRRPAPCGRPKSMSDADEELILLAYRELEEFDIHEPSCWVQLHERTCSGFSLQALWDTVQDANQQGQRRKLQRLNG